MPAGSGRLRLCGSASRFRGSPCKRQKRLRSRAWLADTWFLNKSAQGWGMNMARTVQLRSAVSIPLA
jgi:hypothetical protein